MQVALDSLHYTVLYALTDPEMSFLYQSIPELVSLLYVQPNTLDDCLARNNSNYLDLNREGDFPTDWQKPGRHGCVKRPGYEEGIPVWKMMGWGWWEGPVHPLGRVWSVAPENWGHFKHNDGNTYLGKFKFLSVSAPCLDRHNRTCSETKTVPLATATAALAQVY